MFCVTVTCGDAKTLGSLKAAHGPFETEDDAKSWIKENYGKGSLSYEVAAEREHYQPYYIFDIFPLNSPVATIGLVPAYE